MKHDTLDYWKMKEREDETMSDYEMAKLEREIEKIKLEARLFGNYE